MAVAWELALSLASHGLMFHPTAICQGVCLLHAPPSLHRSSSRINLAQAFSPSVGFHAGFNSAEELRQGLR